MASSVIVVPHDPLWASAFDAAAREIHRVLAGHVLAFHHIGGTSIPGLAAKPIIDMLAVVADLSTIDANLSPLKPLSYLCKGEHGIPGRRFLYRDDACRTRTHQIHAFQTGSVHIGRHLAFRDYVRTHPDVAQQYGELKLQLAAAHPNDLEAYMDAKDAFIQDVERQALAWATAKAA